MKLFRAIAALAVLCITACQGSLAVAAVSYDESNHSLTIEGGTNLFQYMIVKATLDTQEVDTIYMSGPGGSLYYGFEIGRLIAAEGSMVIIPKDTYCASACAFAAMASDYVFAHGELLIHRPYIPYVPTDMTLDEYAGALGVGYLDSQLYLLEMGYPADFMRFIVETTGPDCLLGIQGPDVALTMRQGPVDMTYDGWYDLFYPAGNC